MPPCPHRPRRAAVIALASVLLVACGDGDASACGPILREDLDPASGAHVLPTASAVEYLTDPPTSGPHQPAPETDRVLGEPLPRPVQVGVLERGDVLIQHRDLGPDEVTSLESLAGDGVVVAPGSELPDRVVATAWTAKRTCSEVELDALTTFVDERIDDAPGSDP